MTEHYLTVNFLIDNWEAIVALFSKATREKTYEELGRLRKEITKQTFPAWPTHIEEFEVFLKNVGLTCK